jgi:hypothetical protein
MKLRTITILFLCYCLCCSASLTGRVAIRPEAVSQPDSATVQYNPPRHIRGAPVPDISGPQDIHLDRAASIMFLQKICTSSSIWKKGSDPLRESIRRLIYAASAPSIDSTICFLSGYSFEKIRVPIDRYYVFDSIRIILPLVEADTTVRNATVRLPDAEMFIEAGKKLEKIRLSSGTLPVLKNDTLNLNDSVYIVMENFIPADLPRQTKDTIILVITDTLPGASLYADDFPFKYLRYPFMGDSLEAAVSSLIGYLEERDSTLLKVTGETGRSTGVWLNSKSDNLIRFWLPDGEGDSVTVWYVDTRINVITTREEELRKVTLSKIRPDYWKFRSDISYLLSQGMFSNWAKGGDNNVSSVLDITGSLNYDNKVSLVNSATTARFALGLQATGAPADIRKNVDILEINSKINHKAFGKFDLSGLFQFKSQFLPGYTYTSDTTKQIVSKFFNPATIIFGYGLEYKPDKNTSISFSPLSYKGTYVTDTAVINQTKFGIDPGKRSKNELGAYLSISSKLVLFDQVTMTNRIQFFSNFLSKPQNVDVDWEMIATTSINWFTDLRLNVHLIYDDNTKLPVFENGEPVLGPDGKQKKSPMAQFKELLGVSLVFRF